MPKACLARRLRDPGAGAVLGRVRAVQPADRRSEFVSFWVIVFEMVRQVRFLCDLLVLTGVSLPSSAVLLNEQD